MLGSAIGGYVDPDHIKGPSLGEIPIQTSQEGIPRPIVYGAPQPFGGNIIQTGPLIRVTKEERQGKGGPVLESEEVYQTYAIRICEGPATVLTVWRDGRVIYDRSGLFPLDADSAAFASKALFYTGDETQLPDPSLEALPAANGGGIGTTNAYRGTAYMVVANDNLTPTGGRIPQYQFRMASSATVSETCSEEGLLWWYPLDDATAGGSARELVNGWNGTYADNLDPNNGLQTVAGGPALSATGFGSAYFAGFGGYMKSQDYEVPSMKDLDAWTVSCWACPMQYQGDNGGGSVSKNIARGDSGDPVGSMDWGLFLRYPATPAGEANLYPGCGTSSASGSSTLLSYEELLGFGRNYFMVMTFEKNPAYTSGGGDMKLYINGALVAVENDVGNSQTTCKYVHVGGGYQYASSGQFIGYVADLKGYNYALTQSEVVDKYLYSEDWLELPDAPGNFVNVYSGQVVRACRSTATVGTVTLADIELDIARRCGIVC